MSISPLSKYLDEMLVKPGQKISLKKFRTEFNPEEVNKSQSEVLLRLGIEKLSEIQDKLYANNRYRILIVLQAMDASGKDSVVKHVMTGLNPLGVKVYSFKTPTSTELDHDYFWRHYIALPGRGEIGIHNRSHYENVLVTRVHPEFILNENLPGIHTVKDIDKSFWDKRMAQINRFEKNLAENGTVIIKLYLHLSKKEQKKRFLERIDDPSKNWKFAMGDLHERALWEKYMFAYEQMLSATSQKYAPWYVVPADDKWFTRLSVAAIIYRTLESLDLSYPKLNPKQLEDLRHAREMLTKKTKPEPGKKQKTLR